MDATYIFLAPWGRLPREDELRADEQDADVAHNGEDVETGLAAEGVDGWIGDAACDEVEGEVEVGQGKVGEEELDSLIDEFDVQQDLASHGVVGLPDLTEVNQRVDGCKEGAVEPAAALRDKFRDSICSC